MLHREYIVTEEYDSKTVKRAVVDEDGRDLDVVKSEQAPADANSVSVSLGTQAIRPFEPRSTQTFDKPAE